MDEVVTPVVAWPSVGGVHAPPLAPALEGGLEIDLEAPYGRKIDGTPMKKRGRPRTGETPAEGEPAGIDSATRARLDSVSRAGPRKPKVEPIIMPAPIVVDYDASAQVAATLWFAVGELILGSDWAPEKNEPQIIKGAFKTYFVANGIGDIPPGIALALALGGYAAVRAQKPTVSERIGKVTAWIKNLIFPSRN